MAHYKVRYKLAHQIFFRTLKKVVGDLKLDKNTLNFHKNPEPWPTAVRVFELSDGTRIEIPMEGTVFEFSGERIAVIQSQINKERGSN